MNNLKGKVAVVTGGSRDIGRAVSLRLAAEGAKVCINYCHRPEKAQETLDMIKKAGGEAIMVKADVTKAADVKFLFEETVKAYGKVDILVNNAGGIVGRKKIQEQDEEWYQTLMDLNFKSCWLCTKEALNYMGKGSAIVNISSQAARDGGGPGSSIYACGKAAMLCHTRAMANELGPQGIRVNAVCPGMINTYFHDTFTAPEGREALHRSAPLRRKRGSVPANPAVNIDLRG